MDLHAWMLSDLTAVRSKLHGAIIDRVPAARWREQAGGAGASIAHLLVHLTRHHDLAVNTAVRDGAPLFEQHREPLGLDGFPAWVAVEEHEDRAVSAALSPAALVGYVDDVFDRTATWLDGLGSMVLDTVPDTGRRLADRAGLPVDEVGWLHDMWGGKSVGWLVQWPVIGHGYAHFGEALSVRNRLGLHSF